MKRGFNRRPPPDLLTRLRQNSLQFACIVAITSGCVASEPLTLPIDPTSESVLFAIRGTAEEKARIFAYAPDAVPPLSIGGEEVFVLSYPVDVSALGLAEGEQPRPNDTDPARPFPPGYAAFRWNSDRDGWTAFTETELEEQLGDRVLREVEQCEAQGGCYRRREATDYEYCELPCVDPPDPVGPTPPIPPALPDFGTCPSGWTTRTTIAADGTYCEPPALQPCQPGSTQFLGDDACTRVGASCPADGWPASLPSGRPIHFVRAGATGDGTSKASPFGTIAEAIAASSPLDVIALFAGTHPGGAIVDRSLAIAGACSDTVIAGGSPAIQISVGTNVALSDLTVAGDGDGIAVVGTAMLDGVTVSGGSRGIFVEGMMTARELWVHDARDGGVVGFGPAVIRAERVRLSENIAYGLRLDERAVAHLDDSIISGSHPHANTELEFRGYGALATDGARMFITNALFEGNDGNAIAAWYSATASITMIVDRDGNGDYSFDLDRDAVGYASRLVTLRADSGSVWTFRAGTAHVSDVYVQGSGGGLFGRLGGRLNAERVLLEANSGVGIESSNESTLVLEDVTVRDQNAEGAFVDEGSLTATRLQIVRPIGFGLDVRGSSNGQGAATLTDLLVTGVRSRFPDFLDFYCESDGTGLRVVGDSRVEVSRALFEGGVRGIGFDSEDEHSLDNVLIRGAERHGICAANGSYIVANLRIEDVSGRGLELYGGYMETNDLAVVGTKRVDDPEPSGVGIYLWGINNINVVRIAVLPLRTFLLSDNARNGILMLNGSQAMLQDGEIAGSDTGIELVNQPAFDPTTLYTNVIFRNNGHHLVF
jgi:hypothetical protein